MKKALLSLAALIFALSILLCGCGTPKDDRTPSESAYHYDHIFIELPEGFSVKEESGIFIAAPENDDSGDNIVFTCGGRDNFSAYTEKTMTDIYREKFTGFGEVLSFEKTKIGNHNAIRFVYTVKTSGMEMTQKQIIIFGDAYTDIVTFTVLSGDYESAFAQAESSIIVKD